MLKNFQAARKCFKSSQLITYDKLQEEQQSQTAFIFINLLAGLGESDWRDHFKGLLP